MPYVLFQPNRSGNGLRPRPYSRNMEIQPFTYDSIKTNGWLNGTSLALPHGLGHGWAAVLWDMTWDLIDKHGFNPQRLRGLEHGREQPCDPVRDGRAEDAGLRARAWSSRARRSSPPATSSRTARTPARCGRRFARRGLGFSAVQGTTNRDDNNEAYDTAPQCLRGFQSPVVQPYGSLNEVDAGDAVPLKFTADGYKQLDVLKDSGSPFSRKVDCATLRVPSQNPAFITPREFPVDTVTPGNSKLKVNPQGVFHYNWKTLEEWAGTCRELVLTRDDGKQHRAFFRFL